MNAESAEMTLEEWAAREEDEGGELVDGHLEEDEVTGYAHELVVLWLGAALRAWGAALGVVVGGSEAGFAVGPRRGRKPDLSVFLPGTRKPPRDGLVRTPPSIVVEILSRRPRDQRRDRIEKLADYAAFGVQWYWLVDPGVRTFEVLELGPDGRYVVALGATDGTVESVPGCEGLRLELDQLWREIDALPAEDA